MRDSVVKLGVVLATSDFFAEFFVGESVPGNAAIFCVRAAEDKREQPVEQDKANGEPSALAERLCSFVAGQANESNGYDCKQRSEKTVHKQPTEEGQHQRHKEEPAVAPADFVQQVRAEEWHDCAPAGLSSFRENLPMADDGEDAGWNAFGSQQCWDIP